ncbi:hypothetical protein HPB47_023659 [Ixodes persulcatus]|uniref:Uncharacterized protein n=1 Tax=Ixodes persulcatus TaxID=34615 RepID=A0AC60Q6E4_IXOPE|nr:hypothetical protein HPB47_023659 [Ixodes persulcatus]
MEELDLDALDELLNEELPEEADITEPPTPIVKDPRRNETDDAVSSSDDLERELREMQEKMDRLREQLRSSKRTAMSLDQGGGVTDPYSGIRIINPLVSSTVMEARMTSRKMVKMSLVPTFAQTKKIEDDWVTVGVLVNKSAPKTSKNGKPFSIWKLTDLQDCENLVSIFLFGEVHEKHWKTSVGSVVGFLNPSVMPNKDSYVRPSRDVVSITAKDLLRMHQQKLKGLNGGVAQPQKMSPVLGRGLVNDRVVDLGTASVSGMKPLAASDIAKIKAIQKVRAKGPLVAKDPNAVKQDFTSPEAQARIQRKLDHLESSGGDHSKDEEGGSPKAKKSRLGPAMSKDEMEKLLRQKSSHAHQLDDLETEEEMQYFSVLEKKEQLEEKMLSVKEIQCDVVSCKICKYTAHQASDLCKKENHPLKHHKATKRFFKCKSCSHRTTTFARVPAQSCRKCNGSNFERTSMGKPKEGPKLPEEKLLIRGEEIKYINK